jgi:hypothetical protein
MNSSNRYAGRPLVRLLELYVLDVLGELSSYELQKVAKLTPHLSRLYNRAGTWSEILTSELELPSNLSEVIRGMWLRNQESSTRNRTVLTAQEFAEVFVDENMPVDSARFT